MDTIQVVRTVVGVFFILYGLGIYIYNNFHTLKYVDQINGVFNGPMCIIVGVLISAYTLKQGFIIGIIALVLWSITYILLKKDILKKLH